MRRIVFTILLILFLIIACSNGFTDGISVDKQTVYQNATTYVTLGMYDNALNQFEQIKNYSDSNSWANYCRGMIAINDANLQESTGYIDKAIESIEKAYRYFVLLSGSKFQDSENLSRYCTARRFQLKGLLQSALDEYAELMGSLDSDERYFNIIGGIPLPTQAPECKLSPSLPSIAAHSVQKIETYLGPGSVYLKQVIVSINVDSKIYICGREQNYFLIETIIDNGKIRLWAPTVRILRDENKSEPQIGEKSRKATVLKESEALMGPGEDYIKSGIIIKKGEKVISFESEGLYTMIEYNDKQSLKPVRLWYLSEYLSK
nr:hypothetical protein [Clostridia bacterium]